MASIESQGFPIYPAPTPRETKGVARWRDHSGFVVRDGEGHDGLKVSWVPDGTSPLDAYTSCGSPAELGVVAVSEGRYGMFPAEIALEFSKVLMLLGEGVGYGAVYFFDVSIDVSQGESLPCRVSVLHDGQAAGESPQLALAPGGKVLWAGAVPQEVSCFLDARHRQAMAYYVSSHLRDALGTVVAPRFGSAEDTANEWLALMSRLSFGYCSAYDHRFSREVPPELSQEAMQLLGAVAFEGYVPPEMPWCDEVRDKSADIVRIWRSLLFHEAAGLDPGDWTRGDLDEIGREVGIDYAVEAYLSGTSIEYILAGRKEADYGIPF